ncbi:MAG: hypothetical protein ACKOPM_09345 [Novosphingobium sp.]
MKKFVTAFVAVTLIATVPAQAQSVYQPSREEKFMACLRLALGFITVDDLITCEVWT